MYGTGSGQVSEWVNERVPECVEFVMIRPCSDWRVLLSMLLTIAAFLRPILMYGQSFNEPAHTLALMVVVVFLFFFVVLWLAEKGLRLASVDGRTHQRC